MALLVVYAVVPFLVGFYLFVRSNEKKISARALQSLFALLPGGNWGQLTTVSFCGFIAGVADVRTHTFANWELMAALVGFSILPTVLTSFHSMDKWHDRIPKWVLTYSATSGMGAGLGAMTSYVWYGSEEIGPSTFMAVFSVLAGVLSFYQLGNMSRKDRHTEAHGANLGPLVQKLLSMLRYVGEAVLADEIQIALVMFELERVLGPVDGDKNSDLLRRALQAIRTGRKQSLDLERFDELLREEIKEMPSEERLKQGAHSEPPHDHAHGMHMA